MRKSAIITKEKWAFVAVMATACVWGTNSYAQSDADAVKAAVAAYTAAVDSLDPVTYKLKDGTAGSVNVFLSHVFEKHDGAWLLVSQFVVPVPK
jgi:hypothetical protein